MLVGRKTESQQKLVEQPRGALKTEDVFLSMGPQHPSMHGVLRLLLQLEGERIVGCEPIVGYLHRSIEKMAEGRNYTQFIPVTDRLDYVTAMSANYVFVLAVERLGDIPVTRRGEFIRVIMVELNRIASHLVWLGTFALELGATTAFLYAFEEREKICDLFEATCGQRLLYNYLRLGGVAFDLPRDVTGRWLDGRPRGFEAACDAFLRQFAGQVDMMEQLLTDNTIFLKRTRGVGVLPRETAIQYGCSGPVLRGSGVPYDVRRAVPYSVYPELEFDVPVGQRGDCWDRYKVRMEEMRESAKIVQQCLENLPRGEFKTLLPWRVWLPAGEVYSRIENSRGDMGTYLVSNGDDKAWRCKFRTPSFANLSAMPAMVQDALVADVIAVAASLDFVLPEVDR